MWGAPPSLTVAATAPSQAQVGMIRKLRLGRLRGSAPPRERVCTVPCNRDARVHGGEGISLGAAIVGRRRRRRRRPPWHRWA